MAVHFQEICIGDILLQRSSCQGKNHCDHSRVIVNCVESKSMKKQLALILFTLLGLYSVVATAKSTDVKAVWSSTEAVCSSRSWTSPLVLSDGQSCVFSCDSNSAHPRLLAFNLSDGSLRMALNVDSLMSAHGLAKAQWLGRFQLRNDSLDVLCQGVDPSDSSYHFYTISGSWTKGNYTLLPEVVASKDIARDLRLIGRSADGCLFFRTATIKGVQHTSGQYTYTDYTYYLSLTIYQASTSQWKTFSHQQEGERQYNVSFTADLGYTEFPEVHNGILISPPFVIRSYASDQATDLADNNNTGWISSAFVGGCVSRDLRWCINSNYSVFIGDSTEYLRPNQRLCLSANAYPTCMTSQDHKVLLNQAATSGAQLVVYDFALQSALDTLKLPLALHSRCTLARHDSLLIIHEGTKLSAYSLNFLTTNRAKVSLPIRDESWPCPMRTNLDTLFFNSQLCAEGPEFVYSWDFGDGASAHSRLAQHQYAQASNYTVRCICKSTVNADSCALTTSVSVREANTITRMTISPIQTLESTLFRLYAYPFASTWCKASPSIVARFVHKDTTLSFRVEGSTLNIDVSLKRTGDYTVNLYLYLGAVLFDSIVNYSKVTCLPAPHYDNSVWSSWMRLPINHMCLSKAGSLIVVDASSTIWQNTRLTEANLEKTSFQPKAKDFVSALTRKDSSYRVWTAPRITMTQCTSTGEIENERASLLTLPDNVDKSGYENWRGYQFYWTNRTEYLTTVIEPAKDELCIKVFGQSTNQNPHFPPPFTSTLLFARTQVGDSTLKFHEALRTFEASEASGGLAYYALGDKVLFVTKTSRNGLSYPYLLNLLDLESAKKTIIDSLSAPALGYDEYSRTFVTTRGRYDSLSVIKRHSLPNCRSIECFADQNYVLIISDTSGVYPGSTSSSTLRIIRLSDEKLVFQTVTRTKILHAKISFCSDYFVIAEEDGRLTCFNTPAEIQRLCVDAKQSPQPTSSHELLTSPNPASTSASVSIELNSPADVNIKIYSLHGSVVHDATYPQLSVGPHSIVFDTSNLAIGCWIVECQAGDQHYYSRFVKLRE